MRCQSIAGFAAPACRAGAAVRVAAALSGLGHEELAAAGGSAPAAPRERPGSAPGAPQPHAGPHGAVLPAPARTAGLAGAARPLLPPTGSRASALRFRPGESWPEPPARPCGAVCGVAAPLGLPGAGGALRQAPQEGAESPAAVLQTQRCGAEGHGLAAGMAG